MKVVIKCELLRKREVLLSLDRAIRDHRARFAAGITRIEFGRFHPTFGFDDFFDRSPAEIQAAREMRWATK